MKKVFLLLSLLTVAGLTAKGQWSTNPAVNNIICNLAGEQAIPKVALCPNGDIYIGYFSMESGNYNVRLQRLDALGNILWTWAPNGLLISNQPQETWLTDWDMTADPANHAILVFNDIRNGNTNVYAYRISPAGAFVWGNNGIALSNTSAFNVAPKVIATNAGNMVVAWSADDVIRMQKINPAGTLQWTAGGITVSTANTASWPQLMPVGTDEFFMKYFNDSGAGWSPTRHVYAQRYNASGTGVWASPAVISNMGGISAWTQIFPFIPDGSGGFYIAWHDDRDNNMFASSFVQRISGSGQVLFTANGVEVSNLSNMNHFYPQLARPENGQEIFVFWNEINGNQNQWGIFGQKLSSAGQKLWGDQGMSFIPVSATNVNPLAGRNTPVDMVLFIEEYFNGTNGALKAMRIAPDGSFVWTPFLKPICTVNSQKIHTDISLFQNEQWILTWEDTRNGVTDIYAQNLSLQGTLGPVEFGTIQGNITLNGGFGNVTNVLVQAGNYTTYPDASGFYSMNVITGTYTVTASLLNYYPASQSGVAVSNGSTATVNLTLNANPIAKIEGNVSLLNGTGNIQQVIVKAGIVTTSPDATGHYSMLVTPGTYDVTASLTAYIPDTVYGVAAVQNQVTSNINLQLELAPTTGFMEGTVTLLGGSGNVTDVEVSAGGYITSPNASGFYSLELPVGNYDVMASLSGYGTQMQINVPVAGGQTTPNINFSLSPIPDLAYITGKVTLNSLIGNVTQAIVSAGGNSTHPDAGGNYSLSVPSGTWDVTASHDYTNTDMLPGLSVPPGQTASNIDFTLNQTRTDIICKAIDNYGSTMNGVDVTLNGPEQTYTGTILQDSIVFTKAVFGEYTGTAIFSTIFESDTTETITATHSNITFYFIFGGIRSPETPEISIFPNPVTASSLIRLHNTDMRVLHAELRDLRGSLLSRREAGDLQTDGSDLRLGRWVDELKLPGGIYILRLLHSGGQISCRIVAGH